MIFGGWGRKTKERGQVFFICLSESCRQLQAFGLLENYGYGQIYGVRVAKVGTERFMACTRCRNGYPLTKEQWDYARLVAQALDALPTIEGGDIRASVVALAQMLEPEEAENFDKYLRAELSDPDRRNLAALAAPPAPVRRAPISSAPNPISLMSGGGAPSTSGASGSAAPKAPAAQLDPILMMSASAALPAYMLADRAESSTGAGGAMAGHGAQHDGATEQSPGEPSPGGETAGSTEASSEQSDSDYEVVSEDPSRPDEATASDGSVDGDEVVADTSRPQPEPHRAASATSIAEEPEEGGVEEQVRERRAVQRLLRESLEEAGYDYEALGELTGVGGRLFLAAHPSMIECYAPLERPASDADELIRLNASLPGAAFLATYAAEGGGTVLAMHGRLGLPEPRPSPKVLATFLEALCREVWVLAELVEKGSLD